MIKYKWKVDPKPTGPYASFEKRGWPQAIVNIVNDDIVIASIRCEDDYSPYAVKHGNHKPLTIAIRCPKEVTKESPCPWKWRKLKGEFATLTEAKEAFQNFIQTYPDHNFVIGE